MAACPTGLQPVVMRRRGYSLTELLCVLSIAAVLLALALPSWRQPLGSTATRAAASAALTGLALARRTALATGRTATFCLTSDLTHCQLQGREWMLFTNGEAGSPGRRDGGEALLRRWPLPGSVQVTGTRAYAWYLPQPRAASTLTFTFCHPSAPEAMRSVIVSQTGRPRLSRSGPASIPPPSRCP